MREPDTINVAGPQPVTLRALADQIGALVGKTPRFATQPGAPSHLVADITRMRERLGVVPRMAPEQGLREVVDEFVALGSRW